MLCLIRYREDHESFVLEVDGEEYEPEMVPEENVVLIEDGDNGRLFEVVLENYDGPLEPDTVYELKKIETQVAEGITT